MRFVPASGTQVATVSPLAQRVGPDGGEPEMLECGDRLGGRQSHTVENRPCGPLSCSVSRWRTTPG